MTVAQDWGNFFDPTPRIDEVTPVAAIRAAVRGSAPKVFPTRSQTAMPTTLVQSQPRPPMDLGPMPEMPKPLQQSNEWGDMAKGIAGIMNPEEEGGKKPDRFSDAMAAIDAQLQQMREDREKMLEGINASRSPAAAQQGAGYKGGQGAGSDAAGPEGFSYNVGNLRTSGAGWAGKGAPHNGFETFDTPQSGASAMFHNLASYAASNPAMTVAGAISKWAPPSENNTNAYIAHVAQQSGIDPATPLAQILADPDAAAKIMLAMAKMEKGAGLHSAFTHDLFRSVAGGKAAEKKEAGNAEGGRIRYLRSFLGA